MNDAWLSTLRCPKSRLPLIHQGNLLTCPEAGTSYPIINGIPRLAGETYVASFGRQWNRYHVARDEEDESVFLVKTGMTAESLRGLKVLDAGCGGGRYSLLAAKHGSHVLGVDLSDAVEKAATLCEPYPDTTIIQADLLNLPLTENAFDVAFSIGVMHHSPDPRRAFAEVARRVKPGGRFAVWLYRKNVALQEWVNSGLRVVTSRLPARVLEPLCVGLGAVGGVPVLKRTLNKVANFSNHPDWTLRVCDNFDWYAPKYQSHHTVDELKTWFHEEGYTNLIELPPMRSGRIYDWAYQHDLVIGSGVNVVGTRRLM